MKTINEIFLTQEQINFLKTFGPPRLYQMTESLVYEGQTPVAGYVLLEGKITVEKRGHILQEIAEKSMICVQELIANIPLKYTIKIYPQSSVLILDKSSVFDILKRPEGKTLITLTQ